MVFRGGGWRGPESQAHSFPRLSVPCSESALSHAHLNFSSCDTYLHTRMTRTRSTHVHTLPPFAPMPFPGFPAAWASLVAVALGAALGAVGSSEVVHLWVQGALPPPLASVVGVGGPRSCLGLEAAAAGEEVAPVTGGFTNQLAGRGSFRMTGWLVVRTKAKCVDWQIVKMRENAQGRKL